MKKGIIVLLIAMLATSFAFAGTLTGSASVSYGVGLDENANYGFKNATSSTYKFNFEFDTTAAGKDAHETDFWAEIAAEASAGYVDGKLEIEAEITKADIHVKDVVVGILGPEGPYDYAASFTVNADKEPNYDFANAIEHTLGGVSVKYAGYTLSIAQNYNYKAAASAVAATCSDLVWISDADWAEMTTAQQAKYVVTTVTTAAPAGKYYAKKVAGKGASAAAGTNQIFVGLETKTFDLAEGLTLQAAANGLITAKGETVDKLAGVAANVSYKNEDAKVAASVATDVQYNNNTVDVDVLATGSYDFVKASVYYGVEKAKDQDAEMVLEAKASADIPVGEYKVSVAVEADRLLAVQNNTTAHFNAAFAGFTASASTTIKAVTAKVYGNYNQVVDSFTVAGEKVELYGLNVGANLTYKASMFKCEAGASVYFIDGPTDDLYACGLLPTASISSDKLVENCTLAVKWAGARFDISEDEILDLAKVSSKGTITASATIAF